MIQKRLGHPREDEMSLCPKLYMLIRWADEGFTLIMGYIKLGFLILLL